MVISSDRVLERKQLGYLKQMNLEFSVLLKKVNDFLNFNCEKVSSIRLEWKHGKQNF